MSRRFPRVFLVLLLWVAGLGAAAQFAKIAVPFSWVRATYSDAGADVGWLLSLVSLVGAVLGVVAGDLVGRFGARRILILGLVLGGIISLWQATLPSFTPMLISRVIEGGSHLAIVVAAPTLISQLSSRKYVGAAMTLWSTFFGVSFVFVAWVVLPLLGQGGLSLLFAGHGVFLLMVAVLSVLTLPQIRTPQQDPSAGIFSAHARAYASPWISAPGAGWLVYTLTFVSLLALLPESLPPAQSGLAAGLMPLVSIVVSLLIVPFLLRSLSSVSIVAIGFTLAAALVLLNFHLDWQVRFMVGLFALLGLVQGSSFSAVPELNRNSEDQALAYGLMAQAGNTGNLLGTPLLLIVLDRWGDNGMYLSIAVLYLIGALVHMILAWCRGKARSRSGR